MSDREQGPRGERERAERIVDVLRVWREGATISTSDDVMREADVIRARYSELRGRTSFEEAARTACVEYVERALAALAATRSAEPGEVDRG